MKKSQLSIFVIIGLLIVIISAFVIIRINQSKLNQIKDSPELDEDPELKKIQPVYDYISQCLKITTTDAMQLLGQQGLIYPDTYLSSEKVKISYFYYKGKDYFPDIEIVEEQIQNYVQEKIVSCLLEYSDDTFTIEYGEQHNVNVFIEESIVRTELEYPVTVYSHGEVIDVNKFTSEIKTNYNRMYKVSEEIIFDTVNNPDWIDFEKLYNTDLDIKIVKIDKATIVYVIRDSEIGLENEPFELRFGVKYDF